MIDQQTYAAIAERWRRLAESHPYAVRIRPPSESDDPPTGLVPPALQPAAEALPGLELGSWVWGWAGAEVDGSPVLGGRSAYAPLTWVGREGVCVRLDPETGQPGEVVAVQEMDDVRPVAPDLATFWDELTGFVEATLPEVAAEVEQDVEAEGLEGEEAAEARAQLVGEALDGELQGWLWGRR